MDLPSVAIIAVGIFRPRIHVINTIHCRSIFPGKSFLELCVTQISTLIYSAPSYLKLEITYFPKPVPPPRFKFEVKLARLASRSPDTNFPPTVVPPLLLPWAAPPTPPWGCRISPKNEAPTPKR